MTKCTKCKHDISPADPGREGLCVWCRGTFAEDNARDFKRHHKYLWSDDRTSNKVPTPQEDEE